MTIICGTDFSEGAATALGSAVALATRFGDTELWLTHALDPVSEKLDEGAARSLRAAAENRLEEEAARLRAVAVAWRTEWDRASLPLRRVFLGRSRGG